MSLLVFTKKVTPKAGECHQYYKIMLNQEGRVSPFYERIPSKFQSKSDVEDKVERLAREIAAIYIGREAASKITVDHARSEVVTLCGEPEQGVEASDYWRNYPAVSGKHLPATRKQVYTVTGSEGTPFFITKSSKKKSPPAIKARKK